MTEENKVNEGLEEVKNEAEVSANNPSADAKTTDGITSDEESPSANAPSETEILSAKYQEMNDKYLRLYSDFENFRKQKNREINDILAYSGSDVIKEMLSVMDDFERAIQVNEKTEDLAALREGFQLIYNKFRSILERRGLKEIEAVGKEFDTDLHEALTNIPAPSDDLKGKVVDVAEKGYYLKEKVIRFSKVIVGQ
ncbi:MAG TPA: nucleotide exchange factor GrpE [Luteibaculaceae bacterium]|nr:nucleotide exchange factor GrpE [Luteibaculaceae bacterium]